jgi:predicted metal-dependent phosphoesterase TrpH
MIRADLHSHTKGSDGKSEAPEIVAHAKEAGLDVLCLTDHHTSEAEETHVVADALSINGITAIVGCEYSCHEGHLLVFGSKVPMNRWGMYPPMQAVIDEVNAEGGVCITPHPFIGFKRVLGRDLAKITGLTAVESLNGKGEVQFPTQNRQARDLAKKLGLKRVGGSDSHHATTLGLAVTLFHDVDVMDTEDDFIEALKSGRFSAALNNEVFERVRRAEAFKYATWANTEHEDDEEIFRRAYVRGGRSYIS